MHKNLPRRVPESERRRAYWSWVMRMLRLWRAFISFIISTRACRGRLHLFTRYEKLPNCRYESCNPNLHIGNSELKYRALYSVNFYLIYFSVSFIFFVDFSRF